MKEITNYLVPVVVEQTARGERSFDIYSRYLEVEPPDLRQRVVVDFNYAYNPYCAYNPDWSCPIPPGENWISVSIRAGEKSFSGAYEVAIA